MAPPRTRYRNPPLVEGFCEFFFKGDRTWNPRTPERLHGQLVDTFPTRRTKIGYHANIEIRNDDIKHDVKRVERAQFWTKDESKVIQVAENFLAVNHLRPYKRWEDLRALTDETLAKFTGLTHLKTVERSAIKYINRIDFDSNRVELKDYFTFYPEVSDELSRDFGSFLAAIQVARGDSTLAVEMSEGEPPKPDMVAIKLHLTYSRLTPLEVGSPAISEWLEEGHTALNGAFEACITDNLRKRFGRDQDA